MNWFQERKQRQEIERKMRARQGKKAVERHILKQQRNIERYWGLAKRAARLKDEATFKQISAFVLAAKRDITMWEKRLLFFDMVEARRDQVAAAAEFAQAYQEMAKSMLANSNPQNMAKIQQDIEMGMMKAEMMDDMLANLMDVSEDMLDEFGRETEAGELEQLMRDLRTEAEQEAQGLDDAEIEAGLDAIDALLNKNTSA